MQAAQHALGGRRAAPRGAPAAVRQQQQHRRPRLTTARAADLRTPPAEQRPAAVAEAPGAAGAAEAGGCPFLRGATPPPSASPWYKRLGQLFSPAEYSAEALAGRDVVAAPAAMGMPPQYILGRADLVKAAFAGEADGLTTTAMRGVLGSRELLGKENLVVVPEPRHTYLRKLIMTAFTTEAIEKLVPRMEAVLTKHLDAWADEGIVKAHDKLRKMTFEFIIQVVMGRDYPEETIARLGDLYGTWAKGLLAWPFIDLPFTPFGKALAAMRELHAFYEAATHEARAELAAGRQVPGILGSLVAAVDEDGNRLTDSEIKDNLMLLMLAGHDTSSTTLTNTMAQLQNNRYVVDKLREEQAALIARRGPAIDGSTLKEMPYADAVIRETLRLNNVVSALMRTAAQDIELGGYAIPKGTTLMLPLTHIALNDPRFVDDDPRAFKPERMATPEGQKPGAQMPFGHGPRFCAGYAVAMAEMKVYLALLARGYEFECDTNTKWRQEIGRVPVNGLPTKFTRLAAAEAPLPRAR